MKNLKKKTHKKNLLKKKPIEKNTYWKKNRKLVFLSCFYRVSLVFLLCFSSFSPVFL